MEDDCEIDDHVVKMMEELGEQFDVDISTNKVFKYESMEELLDLVVRKML